MFALGKLQAVEAVTDIARLRHDRAEPAGWWPISQEVDEVLRELSTGDRDAVARSKVGPADGRRFVGDSHGT